MTKKRKRDLMDVLRLLTPGTLLREGLNNILYGRTGALIVLGKAGGIDTIIDGGFTIDKTLSPSNIYELAKMDGAIMMNSKATRILCANVHLNPDPDIDSKETGIRHRIAERVARQTGNAVISISQRRNVITLYYGEKKYVFHDLSILLGKVNQALQTLEKHKNVLDQAFFNLSCLEFEDLVTLEEVTDILQRSEVVLRIAEIVEHYIIELGDEGNLIGMQLEELVGKLPDEQRLLVMDYLIQDEEKVEDVLGKLEESGQEELMDKEFVAGLLGYSRKEKLLEAVIQPRGYRLLKKIPRLPLGLIKNVVQEMGCLADILSSSPDHLDQVEGVGEVRVQSIKRGLKRLREQCLFERVV